MTAIRTPLKRRSKSPDERIAFARCPYLRRAPKNTAQQKAHQQKLFDEAKGGEGSSDPPDPR